MSRSSEVRRITDVLQMPNNALPRIAFEDLVNEEIVINEVLFLQGNFGEYAWLRITAKDGNDYSTVTGSQVVLKKLHAIRDYLPVAAKVVRRKGNRGRRYYDFE